MRYHVMFFLFVVLQLELVAQPVQECGTVLSAAWAAKLKQTASTITPLLSKSAPIQVPYQIHLFKKSDSTSVLSLQDIYKEIDTVNAFYANANMLLVECAPPELIIDDSLYNFESAEESILLSQHYMQDVLNLYFPNTAKSGTVAVCGYSRYPPSVDLAIIAAGCARNGSTLPHEIGHYFGLMHTHETFSGAELVNGSNCSFAGDLICDTPADPTLDYHNVAIGCAYTGTVTDVNGALYQPDVSNIMSYSRKECRRYFSPMQYGVLNHTMQTDRAYLYCSIGVGVRELHGQPIALFPNPGSSFLVVTAGTVASSGTFELYDAYGRCQLSVFIRDKQSLGVAHLPPGLYVYRYSSSGKPVYGKWIKE